MNGCKKIGVSIFGGGGYGAGELLRLFSGHPHVSVVSVISSSSVGKTVSDVHTHLTGLCDLTFSTEESLTLLDDFEQQVVILSLPHGQSAANLKNILAKSHLEKVKIIDLSGDFRLRSFPDHEAHYRDVPWEEALRTEFVYGLPECFASQIKTARYVTNPGCLASAAAFALLPFVQKGSHELPIDGTVVIDAKTGTSGAGRAPQESMHHPLRHANCEAYKVLQHRHEPEIRQALRLGEETRTMFVPHLLPVSRGILVTVYFTLTKEFSTKELLVSMREFYKNAPFVRVKDQVPNLHDVLSSNFCDLSVVSRGKEVVVMSALDNLVKGMAGQAIQNLNLMCGVPETAGLLVAGLGPC